MRVHSFAAASALLAAPLHAAPPHQHGVAVLDIAVERTRITLQFESPLDNLVGFERAPRTDAERKALDAALARLREPAGLFRIDPAAGCKPTGADVKAPTFTAGEHSDVDATFTYDCADATRATHLQTDLFGAFARLQRVQVQVALEKGQRGLELRRPANRIDLRR